MLFISKIQRINCIFLSIQEITFLENCSVKLYAHFAAKTTTHAHLIHSIPFCAQARPTNTTRPNQHVLYGECARSGKGGEGGGVGWLTSDAFTAPQLEQLFPLSILIAGFPWLVTLRLGCRFNFLLLPIEVLCRPFNTSWTTISPMCCVSCPSLSHTNIRIALAVQLC